MSSRMSVPSIADTIASVDFTRLTSPRDGRRCFKEWHHFVVMTEEVDLLVNFSLCDDARPEAPPNAQQARVVVTANDGAWEGDVETFDVGESYAAGGRILLEFGPNRLCFEDGRYQVTVALRSRPIQLELELEPVTRPAYIPSIPMLEGPPLHWVVVPRLLASGWVVVDKRKYSFESVPAYHDHNWGHFLWGHNIAWDWSYLLPNDAATPWSLTFLRLTDRPRTAALSQDILVWRRDRMCEVFREQDLEFEFDRGHFRPAEVFRVPRVMGLLVPRGRCDIPAALTVRGRRGENWIECRCVPDTLSQVLIPSERDLGVTIFNEVGAASEVRGSIDGQALAYQGRSIMEFIRYA